MIEALDKFNNKVEFLKQHTINNDENYKLGIIDRQEWLEERALIYGDLLKLEEEYK